MLVGAIARRAGAGGKVNFRDDFSSRSISSGRGGVGAAMNSCGSFVFGLLPKASRIRFRIAEALPVGAATVAESFDGRMMPPATIAAQQPARIAGTRSRRSARGDGRRAAGSAEAG